MPIPTENCSIPTTIDLGKNSHWETRLGTADNATYFYSDADGVHADDTSECKLDLTPKPN